MANNKVRFGVSNARYSLKTETGYGEWKRIPGAVSIQLEPQESQNDFYADNENYFQQPGSASDNVTIELADMPDYAKIDLLGYREINGNLALPVNYKPSEFVLGFQVEGNETTLRVNVFGGKLTRSSETHSTKTDTTEPETQSYEGTFSGTTFTVDGDDEAYLYYTTTSDKEDFKTWWDEVKTPEDAAPAADASLSSLAIGSIELTPAFDAAVTEYTAETTNATNAVSATAKAAGATVKISVNGTEVESGSSATWVDGSNTVTVVVTNGDATKTYTVTVTKS